MPLHQMPLPTRAQCEQSSVEIAIRRKPSPRCRIIQAPDFKRLAGAVLIALLATACGGGGGGGDDAGTNNTAAPATQAPTVTSGPVPYINPAVARSTVVSPEALDEVHGTTSSNGKLYLGTESALVEIDPATDATRTIVHTRWFDRSGQGQLQSIRNLASFAVDGGFAYFPMSVVEADHKATRVAIGTGIERDTEKVLAGSITQPTSAIATDGDQLFWATPSGTANVTIHTRRIGTRSQSRQVTSLPGALALALAAGGGQVYALISSGGSLMQTLTLYRVTLATGATLILGSPPFSPIPPTIRTLLSATPSGVYWAEGNVVKYVDHGGGTIVTLAIPAGMTDGRFAATTGAIYFSNTNGPAVVHKQMVGGAETPVYQIPAGQSATFQDLVANAANAYLLDVGTSSPATIRRLAPGTAPTDLGSVPGPSGGFLALMNDYLGVVNSTTGVARALRLANGAFSEHRPVAAPKRVETNNPGNTFFTQGSGTSGLGLFRHFADVAPATPALLDANPSSDSVMQGKPFLSGDYVYWIGGSTLGTPSAIPSGYRLKRAKRDGSELVTLHDSGATQLRDPIVVNQRVYYLKFAPIFGSTWQVESIPVAGGVPRHEFGIPFGSGGPRLFMGQNGLAYLTLYYLQAPTGTDVYAIDFANELAALAILAIPYEQVSLAFSNGYLYWAATSPSIAEIGRHPWTADGLVGAHQAIERFVVPNSTPFRPATLHGMGSSAYYWNRGLVRIDD